MGRQVRRSTTDTSRAQLAASLASADPEDRVEGYGAFVRRDPRAVACTRVFAALGDLAAVEVCIQLGVSYVAVPLSEDMAVGECATCWREFALGLELDDKPNRESKPRKVAGARIAQALADYALGGWLIRHRDFCEKSCMTCVKVENQVAAGRAWLLLHDKPYEPGWRKRVRIATDLLSMSLAGHSLGQVGGWPALMQVVIADNAALGDHLPFVAAACGEASTIEFGLEKRIRFNGRRIVAFSVRDKAIQITQHLLS